MKRFRRRKSIIGLYLILLSVVDIFGIVLSGNMGGKFMTLSIVALAVGFYAANAGKMERLAIEKNSKEKEILDETEKEASNLTLFIIQTACFFGTAVSGVMLAFMSRYTGVLTSLVITFGSILVGSFIIEHALQAFITKKNEEN